MKRLRHIGSRNTAALLFAVLLACLAIPLAMAQDQPRWVVAFAQDTLANDWRRAQTDGLVEAFRQHPEVRFIHTEAGGNTARQIQDIEDLVAGGIDLLITSPRDADLMTPVIERVTARGIPVVLLSRRTTGDVYTTFIHTDNRAIARQAADRLARRLNGQGRVLILQHIPTTTPAIERTEGFLEALAKYPGMQVAAIKRADSLRDKAILAVEEALAGGLKFDAIYAQSDSMASGARAALRRAGIDPATIPIIGIDYIAEAREAIRAGEQDASFVYPTFAPEGAEVAMRILRGEPVPKEIVVESRMVTRDNVESVEPIF
jgi:ribose transport system substrate-binding protein